MHGASSKNTVGLRCLFSLPTPPHFPSSKAIFFSFDQLFPSFFSFFKYRPGDYVLRDSQKKKGGGGRHVKYLSILFFTFARQFCLEYLTSFLRAEINGEEKYSMGGNRTVRRFAWKLNYFFFHTLPSRSMLLAVALDFFPVTTVFYLRLYIVNVAVRNARHSEGKKLTH